MSNGTSHGYGETLLEIAQTSMILNLSIEQNYERSSNLYQYLLGGSFAASKATQVDLISMRTNCIHEPWTYSFWFIIDNEGSTSSTIESFPFVIGYGFHLPLISQVNLPWDVSNAVIYGCIENVYGAVTCTAVELSETDDIDFELLDKTQDYILLFQTMTNLLIEMTAYQFLMWY